MHNCHNMRATNRQLLHYADSDNNKPHNTIIIFNHVTFTCCCHLKVTVIMANNLFAFIFYCQLYYYE